MKRMVLLFLLCIGCKSAIRDADVYSAEIKFVESANEEQVRRGIAVIEKYCRCERIDGELSFTTNECSNLAETILVVKSRMKYHLDFMMFLGGSTEERPPEYPPEIPEISSLCPKNLDIMNADEVWEKENIDAGIEKTGD